MVQQGPAFQSRPTFKLFHNDFASSGIWTVGTSPYSERLVRTRKALSSQIAPRLLPIYTPVIHPKLKKLFGDILTISEGPPVDMAEKLHRFGTGQVSEQLMGTALDDDMVGMLAVNETNICKHGFPLKKKITCPWLTHRYSPAAHYWLTSTGLHPYPAWSRLGSLCRRENAWDQELVLRREGRKGP